MGKEFADSDVKQLKAQLSTVLTTELHEYQLVHFHLFTAVLSLCFVVYSFIYFSCYVAHCRLDDFAGG
jgi:hypothetical protein